MQRTAIPELLDTDAGTADEITASLNDICRINAWFGGTSTLCNLIERVAQRSGKHELSVLDVGAGSGATTEIARACLARQKIAVSETLLDLSVSHLMDGSAPRVAADAVALPFRDSSFDLVACTLFTHHLEPEQLVQFANEALRVARIALAINDLQRSAVHLALVYAGMPLFRSRLTRHDAPASVRRAYTPDELESLLRRSAARSVEITHHYLFRLGAIAWKA